MRQDFAKTSRPRHSTLGRQIPPVLWWRSQLCSLGIIRNTLWFIFQIEMFSFSSISRDYISLQEPSQIFVDRPAWLESPISHSVNSDVEIYFIYLMFHTALLLFIFIAFRVLDSSMNYGQSKHVIKVNNFDRSNFWEGKDVDISISSKKIKIMPYGNYSRHLVVYIPKTNIFVFFHIQGLHISASTLSAFRSSSRAGRMASFSLPCIWCSRWLNTSGIP
jgi:hypothetical protein